jgi:hypothetical protein
MFHSYIGLLINAINCFALSLNPIQANESDSIEEGKNLTFIFFVRLFLKKITGESEEETFFFFI